MADVSKNEVVNEEIIPAILIKDLFKSYGKKEVLKGLNLEVYHGELFGFIGRWSGYCRNGYYGSSSYD